MTNLLFSAQGDPAARPPQDLRKMLNSHSRETVFPPCPIAHDGEQEIDSSRFAYEAISPERMQITKQKQKKTYATQPILCHPNCSLHRLACGLAA